MSEVPYPGLRPFRRDEVDVFFGREDSIDKLLLMLGRHRFLAVVGESGCGKSSLVWAGMIPALETGLLATAGARWRVASMRPGEAPLRGLAEALLGPTALGPERAGTPGAEAFLYATLRRGPLGLVETLADTPLPPRTNLLLLVDQFEEIFRYRRHGDRDEADAFVALLLETVARLETPVYVVLTMRSDFLGECALFAGLPETMNDSQFLTPRMSRADRRAAIVGPAGVFGAEVEPGLVNRLLNDMGPHPDQLPLMQHVLMRMWNRAQSGGGVSAADEAAVKLTLAEYEAVGGFDNALSHHADEAFGELDSHQQGIAEVLFRTLSERGTGGRDTRRPARLSEVAAGAGGSPAEVVAVVEVFRSPDRSFLMPPAGRELTAESVLDIIHETLIRQWRRLAGWVEEEAESAAIYRRLVETARLWRAGQAGVWGSPDLDLALAWQAVEGHNALWADRYGGDFDLATEFLAASAADRQAELAAAERARADREKQRRTRQASMLLGAGMLVALVIASVAWLQYLRAEASVKVASASLLVARAGQGGHDHPQRSLLLGVEAVSITPDPASSSAQAARELLLGLLTNVGGRPLVGHTDEVQAAVFTADGRLATASDDGTVRLWSVDPPSLLATLETKRDALRALAASPDGRWLAAAGVAGVVRVWDLATVPVVAGVASDASAPAPVELPARSDSITALAWSPDSRLLASGGEDGEVRLWAATAGPNAPPVVLPGEDEEKRSATSGGDEITSVAFSPDGRWLAAGNDDNKAQLWRLRDGGVPDAPFVLDGHGGTVQAVMFTSDGRWLATGSEDNNILLWRLDDGTAPPMSSLRLEGHRSSVGVLAVSPDSRWLASGSHDSDVRLWDLEDLASAMGKAAPKAMVVLAGHTAPIIGLAVSLDSRWLVSASWDHTARIWNLAASEPAASSIPLVGHDEYLLTVAVSPDGRTVATAGGDDAVRLWPLVSEPGPCAGTVSLSGHLDAVASVATSPDGRWVVTASEDNTARLWDLSEPNFSTDSRRLIGHQSSLRTAAISPDGRWLATGSDDNSVRLWSLGDLAVRGNQVAAKWVLDCKAAGFAGGAPCDASANTTLAFTPDSRWLATGSRGNDVRLWPLGSTDSDPSKGTLLLEGHADSITAVAVSSDGRWLASASEDHTARLWDLQAPEKASTVLAGHDRKVNAVAFSPDMRWLATASEDETSRVWELSDLISRLPGEQGREAVPSKHVLAAHTDAVIAIAFVDGGRRLATGSDDSTVRLWDLSAADPNGASEVLEGHREGIIVLAVLPRGKDRGTEWLVSASWDGSARLWDLGASPAVQTGALIGHRGAVVGVAFSGAGDRIVTGSEDHTARVWCPDIFSLTLPELVERAKASAGSDHSTGDSD